MTVELGADFQTLFRQPPEKAVKAWEARQRLLLPSTASRKGRKIDPEAPWRAADVLHHAHSRAFFVARMTRADVLHDIHQSLDRALKEGKSFESWRKELEPTLRAKGWWSGTEEDPEAKSLVRNPRTGQEEWTRLGTPRRLRTIYETNQRVSFASGHHAAMKRTARLQPWWVYRAVMDEHTRQPHAALNNLCLRHDDPAWSTIYPPNGWGCRCGVFSMSERQVRARTDLNVQERSVLETKTVRLGDRDVEIQGVRTAHGTIFPEPEWAYNVAEYGHATETLAWSRIETLPAPERDAILSGIASDKALQDSTRRGWESFVRGTLGTMQRDDRPTSLAVGWLSPARRKALQEPLKKAFQTLSKPAPEFSPFLVVDGDALVHAQRTTKKSDGRALSIDELLDLPAWIQSPYRVVVDGKDGHILVFSKPFREGKKEMVRKAVFQAVDGGPLRLVTAGREEAANLLWGKRQEIAWP